MQAALWAWASEPQPFPWDDRWMGQIAEKYYQEELVSRNYPFRIWIVQKYLYIL